MGNAMIAIFRYKNASSFADRCPGFFFYSLYITKLDLLFHLEKNQALLNYFEKIQLYHETFWNKFCKIAQKSLHVLSPALGVPKCHKYRKLNDYCCCFQYIQLQISVLNKHFNSHDVVSRSIKCQMASIMDWSQRQVSVTLTFDLDMSLCHERMALLNVGSSVSPSRLCDRRKC